MWYHQPTSNSTETSGIAPEVLGHFLSVNQSRLWYTITMPPTERKYINPRPVLSIEFVGEKYISRCYSTRIWKVTSRSPLSSKEILSLRNTGFLGSGQGFTYHQLTPSGARSDLPAEIRWPLKVEPTGTDRVECSEVDNTGKVIQSPSYNPYSGKLDEAVDMPYYVYICEDRVDSGD